LKQTLEIDDQQPLQHYILGNSYRDIYQYDKAIYEYEKALELPERWDTKPIWTYYYTHLGYAYHMTGQYKKERMLYKKAEQDFPDDPLLLYNQAVLSLTQGDAVAANRFIERYISICKDQFWSEARIANALAKIYFDADKQDKAEEYYRQALSLEPENPERMNNLAWFLIDKDRNVEEGMGLIDKALVLSPYDYLSIDTKGWGCYKQGKYKEALDHLEKAWTLKPVYDHELYLHLEEAKKAVARQR
jgi:Tfp pilus assembly protein PilF